MSPRAKLIACCVAFPLGLCVLYGLLVTVLFATGGAHCTTILTLPVGETAPTRMVSVGYFGYAGNPTSPSQVVRSAIP